MKAPRGILLTDVDGTMPHPSVANAVLALAERMGVVVVLITARTLASAVPLLSAYRIRRPVLAVECGALVLMDHQPLFPPAPVDVEAAAAAAAAAKAGACRLDDWNRDRSYTQCVMMPSDLDAERAVRAALEAVGYTVTSSGATSVVHPVNVHKGTAARRIISALGDAPAMAIGDSNVDVPMVHEVAGHSRIISGPAEWEPAVVNWLVSLGGDREQA